MSPAAVVVAPTRRLLARVSVVPQPLRVFVWSRLLVWAVAAYGWLWIVPRVTPPPTKDLGYVTEVWSRWDAGWFLGIAQSGYHSATDGRPAFFPLYPLLVGLVGRALDGYYLTAAIVVSLACCAGSFLLLHRLARGRFGPEVANRSVLFLALFPMSLFLQAPYSESLFLLCCLAAFAFAEREQWTLAGTLTGLALLTRPSGVALFCAIVVCAWRSRQRLHALASLLIAPVLFGLYPAWLDWKTGDAFAFVHAEAFWNRHLAPAGPLSGLWQGAQAAWAGIEQLATGSQTHVYWRGGVGSDALHGAAHNLENFAFLLVFLALAVVAWRRLGAAYGLFAVLALALPLSTPGSRWPLQSMPRFCLTVFPAFVALALLANTSRRRTLVVSLSAVLLGVAITEWTLAQWVS